MIEVGYDGSLEGLFAILLGVCGGAPPPDRIRCRPPPSPAPPREPELFDPGGVPDRRPAPGLFPGGGAVPACLPGAEEFFAISAGAFDSFLCGWMSEFPIEAECIRFGGKVIAAAGAAAATAPGGITSAEARLAAEKARTDRGDPDVRTVLDAAYKVRHETDRLLGFLRFRPDSRGAYIARCAPDHFVLPRLAGHFSRRFGDTPWLIIDEKRGLCLLGDGKGEPRLSDPAALPRETSSGGEDPGKDPGKDPWEELWLTYHASINNPGRKNPGLQRQFMPLRYWKYLPETGGG